MYILKIFKFFICNISFALSASEPVTFNSLKNLIEEKKISTIESLLPFLPAAYRSKYILMFKSRSLHDASYENPRVLMYGEDAKFIITFNGANNQKGYDAIETMEYNDQDKEFYYREILFPEGQKKRLQFNFSEPNPEKCIKCHGSPARPIWDTHPLWPGAYGERYLSPLSPQEQVGLLTFLSYQPTHSRYKNLINTKVFTDKNTFNPSFQSRYIGTQKEAPNEELSKYLSIYNARRIAKIAGKASDFNSFQYLLLASLSRDCENIESFIPEKYRKAYIENYIDFSAFVDEKNKEQVELKNVRSVSFSDWKNSYQKSEINSLNSFRFIAETFLGLPTTQWTTAFEEGTFDFSAPRLLNLELETELLNTYFRDDPILQNLNSLRHVSSSDKYCSYLQKKSLLSFSTLPSQKIVLFQNLAKSIAKMTSPDLIGKPAILRGCINCHQGSVAPKIPFNQPKILAIQLSATGYPRGSLYNEIIYRLSSNAGNDRMPRGANITEKERVELAKYLSFLKASNEIQNR